MFPLWIVEIWIMNYIYFSNSTTTIYIDINRHKCYIRKNKYQQSFLIINKTISCKNEKSQLISTLFLWERWGIGCRFYYVSDKSDTNAFKRQFFYDNNSQEKKLIVTISQTQNPHISFKVSYPTMRIVTTPPCNFGPNWARKFWKGLKK